MNVRADRQAHLLGALKQMRRAVGLLTLAIMLATCGYKFIEHVEWFDAYYMAIVTLSTVGFGEVIPLSEDGRVFTSFLILFNIGFFTYAISTLTSIFVDGNIHNFFMEYNMNKKIQGLRGHTIVCGFGRHASEVCQELSKQKNPFVIIESDSEKLHGLQEESEYLFIQGDATVDSVLIDAGIQHAKSLVVTLPVDANNLFIVISSRQLNPALNIICRLNHAIDEGKLLRAGANHVVAPERIGGYYMATLVNKPNLVEFFSLVSKMGTNEVAFEEILVSNMKEKYQGRTMADSNIQTDTNMPVVGIRHIDGHYQLNPPKDQILDPRIHVVILGTPQQIQYFSSVVLKPFYLGSD
jgi:voltage-gated potassium channel